MKVILTAEVKGKGHEGDVVEVAQGYAVNYLLPRKMAIQATPGAVKQLEARMSNIQKRNAARLTDAESIAAVIDGKTIRIEAKAGQDGKLFGSVTALMIEEAIAAQLGADIDHKRMNMHHAIKTTGDHEVVVSVFGDVRATVIVRVVPEGAAVEPAPAVVAERPVSESDAAPVTEDEDEVEAPAESDAE